MSGTATDSVPSPCRDVCQLDAAGICIGCGRSGVEIGEWLQASPGRRRQICALARGRLEQASKAPQAGEVVDRGAS